MTEIKIEKNVPIPPKGGGPNGPYKYPFDRLGVGDCFSVSGVGGSLAKITRRLRGAAHRYSKSHGIKFTVRELPDEGVVRIWRVE